MRSFSFWVKSVTAWFIVLNLLCSGAGLAKGPETAQVVVDGAVIDYATSGHGPPLLMLTGYSMTKEMWDTEFIRTLSLSHRLILMDNRGMGPGGLAKGEEVSIARMAKDAGGLIRALGLERADVLGWSMGGMVGLELALAEPAMVRSLILLSSVGEIDPVLPALERMAKMNHSELVNRMFPEAYAKEHPGVYARLINRPRPAERAAIEAQYRAMLDWPGVAGKLSWLAVPVLVLAGAEDWVCPPEASQDLFGRLPQNKANRLELIANGSHWLMHQFPDDLAARVNAFTASQTE